MICSDMMSWEGHFFIVFFPQTHNPSLIMRKASDNKVVAEGYFPGSPVARIDSQINKEIKANKIGVILQYT